MHAPFDGWWHVVLGTRGSWLPGDQRGFRNHDHRIHSSGDYRTPPPPGEHAGLLRYHRDRSRPLVLIPPPLRPKVLTALREAAIFRKVPLLAICVGDVHAHLLLQFDGSYADAKSAAGRLKTGSSFLLRDVLPGRLWSSSTSPKPIRDQRHLSNCYWYIVDGQEPGAAVWGDADAYRVLVPNDPKLPLRCQGE